MGNFDNRRGNDRNRRPSGGRGFDRSRFDRRDRGDRQMHKAVCDNCGKDCEVPFKPTAGKPIYCSDCFEKMGNGNSRGGDDRRDDRRGGRRDFGDRRPQNGGGSNANIKLLESLNTKLDKIIKLLETRGGMEEKLNKKEFISTPAVQDTIDVEVHDSEASTKPNVEIKAKKTTKKTEKKKE